MQARLRFLGAARNVTGSCYMLQVDDMKLLVDCGFYQERAFKKRNWGPFPVPPSSVDVVLLTHAHLDHCGLLPKLVREGFRGKIYCTQAAAEIAQIVMLDSARIQEEDAAFKKRRHQREGRQGPYPEVPPYTVEDAEAVLPLFTTVNYREPVPLADGVQAIFYDAGHILGSSMIVVGYGQGEDRRTVLFSGDIGRTDRPIIEDPTRFFTSDYVVVESTYGDRLHDYSGNIIEELEQIINSTYRAGGNIVIPSFAIERAQELLYYISELRRERKIPPMLVFLDSPMAVKVTEVFRGHPETFDREMAILVEKGKSPFDFPGLVMTETAEQSKAINEQKETSIIIAGSGMCAGGRIKHHLVSNISRPESTIVFVGYQAIGTLGRIIVDGTKEVRILGQTYPVRARIERIEGFSAHADRDELLSWISGMTRAPRQVFVTHGEAESVVSFAEYLTEKTSWKVSAPDYLDEVLLS